MLPYKVTVKYEILINALREAGTSADCGDVALVRPIGSCFRSDDAVEVFDCTLYLKSWRWKGVSTKERINILVHAKERIRRADHALLTSTVCVNYFTVVDGKQKLLQAFHYDYDPTQTDHPLFHLQVTNRCIALPAADGESLEIQMPDAVAEPVLRCARVPT